MKRTFYQRFTKRFLGFFCAFFALILLSPVFLCVALMVKLKLGSPVIFTQDRPGKDERIFKLYKFRSMTDARDENGELLPDEVRLTKFGRVLRSTSLDELPEVWNILKGDMSFVGPRPLLVRYLPRYSATQKRRHEVRPGLSGYAQIHGRNTVTWEEKFDLDVWYVDHLSFGLDVKILLRSVAVAFKRDGINSATSATMEEFMGSKKEA